MKTVQEYVDIINNAVDSISYPSQPAGLYEPVKYMLSGGGKRLRPILLLATCDALGGDSGQAVSQALGLEMFHNFTLLHDDVMDRSDMRHGRPTVHKRWNESTAILSGDAMLTLSSVMMGENAGSEYRKIVSLFNKTAVEVYEGQQYDMDFETRNDVTADEYIEMIRLKTSVLIGCACAIGAVKAGASEQDVNAMYDYGTYMGLAFQLRDDWLDSFGNADTFGKMIGGDILNDKKTYLLITALNNASPEQRDVITSLFGSRESGKIDTMVKMYRSTGAEQKCVDMIDHYSDKALGALDKVAMCCEARDLFVSIVKKAITRDR